MFSKPVGAVGHKRLQLDRDLTFRRPSRRCYACYDTGVVTNGDGLVEQLLPDYDRTLEGRRIAGQDAPLVCTCEAACRPYPHGLRGPDGLLAQGRAAQLTAEQVGWLHEQREAAWSETERLMREARMARAAGDPKAMPWFIAEVRSAIAAQLARHRGAGGADSIGTPSPFPTRRLQPLGGVIADVLSPTPPEAPGPGVVVPLRPAGEGADRPPQGT
jgi:hypothetical protein